MKTESTCLRCGEAFTTDQNLAGRRVRCLTCGLIQKIPTEDVATRPAPAGYQLAPAPALFSRSAPAASSRSAPAPSQPAHQSRFPWFERLRPWVLPAHQSSFPWFERLRPWIFETSQVQGIGTWLIILSAADLFMTFALLRKSPNFFEANPIAQWFFANWNMTGMVAFKFSMIAGVILLSEIIERKRPGWGRFVLLVGCIGAAYAVFTGGRLYMIPEAPVNFERD
jgi:Domain of unknown function (DUF5658)